MEERLTPLMELLELLKEQQRAFLVMKTECKGIDISIKLAESLLEQERQELINVKLGHMIWKYPEHSMAYCENKALEWFNNKFKTTLYEKPNH